jgi:TRAP-type mannitol/chloroaromatic compound transport system permease small subunit
VGKQQPNNLPNKKNSGQALIEYIILLSIMIGIFALILPGLSKTFDVATTAISGKMETQLRTGMAPATLWTQ